MLSDTNTKHTNKPNIIDISDNDVDVLFINMSNININAQTIIPPNAIKNE